ncbi:DUF1080 domain-containing protein [Marinihelvus fidelis]|uniref:DUF1080 domain-containing protein n=1 Tax=Marinihelvus fidelis TaxID=2613842 RepID=A0A5N0TDW8_9GAMM|nr:DUF1080 domain-containing protein [Marinihelvus fidelis]KAA9132654.1 DUF1080 domain-containing protein [Marinihelvus fidelis]
MIHATTVILRRGLLAATLATATCATGALAGDTGAATDEDWVSIFNGENLDGWTPKIRTFEPGVNFAETFRVEDGALTVAYDGYEQFEDRFGHIFYEQPFSYYRLRFEYRFYGDQAPGGADWAWRNSGAMLHSQAPESMSVEQDFPISAEFQFLGGRGDGTDRATGNLCTPGTHVTINGNFTTDHCITSSSPTFDGDQWVRAEALVLGSERIVHYINGKSVMEYTYIVTEGGVAANDAPRLKPEGSPLGEGYVSLQSESAPVQFRNIEVLVLVGCMDENDPAYRSYFVKDDPEACEG